MERARIQNSFLLTDVEKRKKEIELLEREEKATRSIVEQLLEKARLARDDGNEAAAAAYEGQVGQYEDQSRGLSNQRAGLEAQADPESIRQQMQSVMVDLENQMGTLAQRIGGLFRDVIGSAVDSIAQGISGLIQGTMTWSQALANIGNSILTSIINSLARMVAQWIVQQILMWTIGRALQGAAVAAQAPMATASAAMWATPAFLASVASYGGAVTAGEAALSAGAASSGAAMSAMSAGMSAGGAVGGGFKEGGYTGDGNPNEVAGVVHRGEFVFPAPVVSLRGRGFFENIARGMSAGISAVSQLDVRRPAWVSQGSGGPMAGVQPQGGYFSAMQPGKQEPPVVNLHVGVVDSSSQKIKEFLLTKDGQKVLFDFISGNRLNFGIQT